VKKSCGECKISFFAKYVKTRSFTHSTGLTLGSVFFFLFSFFLFVISPLGIIIIG